MDTQSRDLFSHTRYCLNEVMTQIEIMTCEDPWAGEHSHQLRVSIHHTGLGSQAWELKMEA